MHWMEISMERKSGCWKRLGRNNQVSNKWKNGHIAGINATIMSPIKRLRVFAKYLLWSLKMGLIQTSGSPHFSYSLFKKICDPPIYVLQSWNFVLVNPADTWHLNDVVLSIRRYFDTKCPLGFIHNDESRYILAMQLRNVNSEWEWNCLFTKKE